MTKVVVDRLRIACRARASRRAAALATHRRLQAVARDELPRALAARAHGWPDVALGSLSVALEFDPAAYDDVTLAVLWADRIGAAVERVARAETSRCAGAPPGRNRVADADMRSAAAWEGATPPAGASSSPEAVRPAAWAVALLDLALAGDAVALPRVADALADPALRAGVLAAVPPGAHARLAARLEALAGAPAPPASAAAAAGAATVSPTPAGVEPAGADAAAGAVAPATPAARARLRAAGRLVRDAQGTHARSRRGVPRSTVLPTSCAGVVLAYPWLGTALERAATTRPALDAIAARRHALAALAGTPAAADDPLVRLLAGDDVSEPATLLAVDPEPEAAADAADAILRRIAAALPGFARSSPAFIRRELIVRAGTLDPAVEPVPVTLAPAPLDVLLPMIPYPLGLFQLAWTPALTIRVGSP